MTTLRAPATCIPDLNVSFDVNRDWPCKRAQFIASLHAFIDDIRRTETHAARVHDPARRRNLATWVADAETRYAQLAAHLDEKVCTCWQSGLYGCAWCHDVDTDPVNPERELCRSHLAEWEGLSELELDRMEREQAAEIADLYG